MQHFLYTQYYLAGVYTNFSNAIDGVFLTTYCRLGRDSIGARGECTCSSKYTSTQCSSGYMGCSISSRRAARFCVQIWHTMMPRGACCMKPFYNALLFCLRAYRYWYSICHPLRTFNPLKRGQKRWPLEREASFKMFQMAIASPQWVQFRGSKSRNDVNCPWLRHTSRVLKAKRRRCFSFSLNYNFFCQLELSRSPKVFKTFLK